MKIPLYALPHRVTIASFLGSGAYGPKYGAEREKVPANIAPKVRTVKGSNGEDIMQSAEAIFQAGEKIQIGDKVTWPQYGLTYVVTDWTPVEMMGPHSIKAVLANG